MHAGGESNRPSRPSLATSFSPRVKFQSNSGRIPANSSQIPTVSPASAVAPACGASASVPWLGPDPALKPWFCELGALPAAAAIQTNDDELLPPNLISNAQNLCWHEPHNSAKGVSILLRNVQHCDAKSEKRRTSRQRRRLRRLLAACREVSSSGIDAD